jgi:uncharacterized protein YeeX (DUF496 family)
MNVDSPEEQLALLKRKYLKSLQLEEKLNVIIKNPKTDEAKIQDYIFQLDTAKQQRRFLAKQMKELIDSFPLLVDSLDAVNQIILNKANRL